MSSLHGGMKGGIFLSIFHLKLDLEKNPFWGCSAEKFTPSEGRLLHFIWKVLMIKNYSLDQARICLLFSSSTESSALSRMKWKMTRKGTQEIWTACANPGAAIVLN